jgi:hypothetical protein
MTKYIVYDEFRVNNGAQFFFFFVFTRSECTAKEQLMNKLDENGINHRYLL